MPKYTLKLCFRTRSSYLETVWSFLGLLLRVLDGAGIAFSLWLILLHYWGSSTLAAFFGVLYSVPGVLQVFPTLGSGSGGWGNPRGCPSFWVASLGFFTHMHWLVPCWNSLFALPSKLQLPWPPWAPREAAGLRVPLLCAVAWKLCSVIWLTSFPSSLLGITVLYWFPV